MTQRIEPLKKLQLRVTLAGNAETEPITFAHIYGLAQEGLSPFECALQGKKQGDSLLLSVPGPAFTEFFGNCAVLVQDMLNIIVLPKMIELDVEIIQVTEADHREIVKSIAAAASHGGCGGSCGCGCG